MKRIPIISGNWKMFKTGKEAQKYLEEFIPLIKAAHAEVMLGVPFTSIRPAAEVAQGSNVQIGAQNMHEAIEGAFTGEISAPMLKEAGATFVILGHSERRNIFKESSTLIQKKVVRALSEGLKVILCLGELEEEREKGLTENVLRAQIEESLKDVSTASFKDLIVAYEPVWAIGTGKTATDEMAQSAHRFCRSVIAEKWGAECAEGLRILYGGSVKPENIAGLMAQPDIDGALVGGASLKAPIFSQVVNY
jgi:triosephosphate isomerase